MTYTDGHESKYLPVASGCNDCKTTAGRSGCFKHKYQNKEITTKDISRILWESL